MNLFLMDKYFKPIVIVPGFTSFIWSSCYSEPGSFELYLKYDKELFKILLLEARYIFRTDTKKLGYIQNLKKSSKTSNGSTILLSGPHLEGITQKYIFKGIASTLKGTLPLTEWLKNSLLNIQPFNVSISEEFGSDLMYTLDSPKIVDSNAQALIYAMLRYHKVSLTHEKLEEGVTFRIWQGRDRSISQPNNPVLLSEKIGNICNLQYQKSEAGCYNVVHGTGYTDLIQYYRDNGLRYVYPDDEEIGSIDKVHTHFEFDLVVDEYYDENGNKHYEVNRAASYQRFLSEAPKHLVPISESFSADLIDPSIVELGDIVSIRDEDTGIILDKRVEKVIENYSPNKKELKVTFGEPIRTIKDVLTKSMGME